MGQRGNCKSRGLHFLLWKSEWTYSMNGGREEVRTRFWRGGNLREEDNLEDPGVDGRITLKWIFEKWDGGYVLDRSGSG